jgi:hypothetical protein
MNRIRLRPAHSPPDLQRIYAQPHQHNQWPDHRLRVNVTAEIAQWMADEHRARSVADLSCGDATIARRLTGMERVVLGDFAPGYPIVGPIERTVEQLEPVDLFVLSETLEHLDDPDAVLRQIRAKARCLVLSTPEGEQDDGNPEHYWGWDSEAVEAMLTAAGWTPVVHNLLGLRETVYDYQVWGCR